MADNLPPADELFAVRAEIKRLTSREAELKQVLLADPSARTGNSYVAVINDVETTRTDLAEMRKMHPAIVEQFSFPARRTRVELRGIDEDGVITPIKRRS